MQKFLLYCGLDGDYTLSREGEDWRKNFRCMHKALDYAQGVTTATTPISVRNVDGVEIIEGKIWPVFRPGRVFMA